jgi:hypothetical protein
MSKFLDKLAFVLSIATVLGIMFINVLPEISILTLLTIGFIAYFAFLNIVTWFKPEIFSESVMKK